MAAPGEQPREDYPDVGAVLRELRERLRDDLRQAREDRRGEFAAGIADAAVRLASLIAKHPRRSASPSAVPAVPETQATEQTTETTRWWRIVGTNDRDGAERVVWESGDPYSLDEVDEVLAEMCEDFAVCRCASNR